MKVRYTTPARHDLESIYDYISERNPSAARRVKARIRDVAEQLGGMPLMGRSTDKADVRLRAATPYPYLIFYTVRSDEVLILHIRHGARRPINESDD